MIPPQKKFRNRLVILSVQSWPVHFFLMEKPSLIYYFHEQRSERFIKKKKKLSQTILYPVNLINVEFIACSVIFVINCTKTTN